MKEYKIKGAGTGFDFLYDLPWKKIATYAFLAILIIGVVIIVYKARTGFKDADLGGTKPYVFHSSLLTDSIVHVPDSVEFRKEIVGLLEKGTKVEITFSVENGKSSYENTWTSPDTLLAMTQTNQRYDYFRDHLAEGLFKAVKDYNTALNMPPYQVFFLLNDETEGYHDTHFSFEEKLGKNCAKWLRDPKKQNSVIVFTIGYNPVPGMKRFDNVTAATMAKTEQSIHEFFQEVIETTLDSTQLLSQIAYAMTVASEFPHVNMTMYSDLLENVPGNDGLNAYAQDARFNKFVSGNWAAYRQHVMNKAGATDASFNVSGIMTIHLPKGNSAYGKTSIRKKWYTALNQYLTETYPGVVFDGLQ